MPHGNSPQPVFQSSHNIFAGSLSNGTSSAPKKMRRSHSVSPMRLSRNTYAKGNDRHNVRVLRMLDSTIAAGAKITKFLPPIDGPEAPRILSYSSSMVHEGNNNDNHPLGIYNQPLQVDIPEQHSPNVPPPTLPYAFGDERRVPSANHIEHVESSTYCSGNLDQLSPPTNAIPCDRISPTMPVLVPHSLYSPSDTVDSSLPILKKAKLDVNNTTPSQSVYNALTLPFNMSTIAECKKVQSVPPIISQPRKIDENSYARLSSVQPTVHQSSVENIHGRTHGDKRNVGYFARPCQKELEYLLMQLGRKAAEGLTGQQRAFSSASAPRTSPSVNNMMTSTTMLPASKSAYPTVARTHRTTEEEKQVMRRLLLQKRDIQRRKLMEQQALVSNQQKQEPEIVDLTSSPPPPIEIKQEQQIEQHEQTSDDEVQTLLTVPQPTTAVSPEQKDPSLASSIFRTPPLDAVGRSSTMTEVIQAQPKTTVSPEQKDPFLASSLFRTPSLDVGGKSSTMTGAIKTQPQTIKSPEQKNPLLAASIFRTPPLDVVGRSLTMKEAIERALESAFEEERKTDGHREAKSDCARPISLVLNSKLESASENNLDGKEGTHSFCQRHRRLLFPSEAPKNETTATPVSDKPILPHTTTFSEVIHHFITHDPRKKHLASLKSHREVSSTSPMAKEEDADTTSTVQLHQRLPSSTSAPTSPSLSISTAEHADQRGRRRLNMEINRIANTASYVGDLPKKPRTGDLLVDSSLLDREERALQRAMQRFSEMEQKARFDITNNNSTQQDTATKPNVEQKRRRPVRRRPPRGRGRGLNRAAKLVKVGRRRRFPWRLGRPQIAKRVSPRKRKLKISRQRTCASTDKDHKDNENSGIKTPHKFLDFQPEILESRTRHEGNNLTDINSVEKSSVEETPSVQQNEPVQPIYVERGRNSVRKRMPYHKNARYELEIEKEEAKLVERKRKRTVSYSSNSGADTTDDAPPCPPPPPPPPPVMPVVESQPIIKRKRGRPRKTEAEKALAAKLKINARNKGVGRGKYLRSKKTMPKKLTKKEKKCSG
ncbi:uncharacterized protein [Amphiura filiformis]|uniref:uncharacterized protein isoform X2 n=1 Tax=Amphiura filiformis TaxID=82378 RepID=UPI003B2227C7